MVAMAEVNYAWGINRRRRQMRRVLELEDELAKKWCLSKGV